jgi:LmbE family N-acetylglucosaminyl deacetylase
VGLGEGDDMTDQPLGTVLSVWAHPDDETYLAGGLMAAAVDRGSRVVCVTATRGELGSSDEQRWPSGETLAALRTQELAKALSVLGISEHHWLDYPDGGCAAIDDDEAVARLRELVEDVRPDTVLTFGPEGMTGHDDHKSVCRWTMKATAGSAAAVHWATQSPEWMEQYGPTLEELGAFMNDVEPPVTPVADMSVFVRLDGDELDRKVRSMLEQESQIQPLVAATSLEFFRAAVAEESFRRAHPAELG